MSLIPPLMTNEVPHFPLSAPKALDGLPPGLGAGLLVDALAEAPVVPIATWRSILLVAAAGALAGALSVAWARPAPMPERPLPAIDQEPAPVPPQWMVAAPAGLHAPRWERG